MTEHVLQAVREQTRSLHSVASEERATLNQPFIVLGDRTSHGGTVISADFTCDIDGKYLARVGDMVACPRKGCRGTFPIVTGAPDMISMGQAPARHGDKTACGATLISGQVTTSWSSESSNQAAVRAGRAFAVAEGATTLPATDTGLCMDCLLKAAASGASLVVRG
jgi:uncharacterized Zn-binding protein involved in type VI secretion